MMQTKGNTDMLTPITKARVKLVGTDGNAFAILGAVKQAMRKANVDAETQKAFMDEAMSGDYNNVLVTAMKYCTVS
jgi:hypothetical protein